MDDAARLSGLYVYPIKSCSGVSLDSWEVDGRGLRYDRRWMLVDASGRFLSQRALPRMALIRVGLAPGLLSVDAPGMPRLEVPLGQATDGLVFARIWRDSVKASPVGARTDRWFSEFLGTRCRLLHLPEDSVRTVDPAFGRPGDQVHLADGFPFLLVSEASLADLNERLERPVPMDRFRPNLVVRGFEPFAEDGWSHVRIGALTFRVVKPCARCAVTTVDQTTGERGREPLHTLARFRTTGTEVFFGQNLIHNGTSILRVGDPVEAVYAPARGESNTL
ncbi:MAG TPA: MOSC N-terminal beta barrel domain-containing protein [Rubrobacteraceae bacterium]|nr:MOSC N-terminal beta barrel domain-containing protein [Rubrobacteraceae bacterium]